MMFGSEDTEEEILAQRIIEMFKEPAAHMEYLKDVHFAYDILRLCQMVRLVLEKEPRVAFLQSPVYVFGDVHGNLEDLHFFSDNIWRLGMALTAGNFLFLGDYVDRGKNGLEVVAYLLAMKVHLPHKVFLLRGNHETRDVNGWEEHYGDRSFIYQCRERFGDDLGYQVWENCNQVFDRMPLSAVIDQDIFCVHGGIPRPIAKDQQPQPGHAKKPLVAESRLQDILKVPHVAGINPPYEHEDELLQQVASDCIWSDPASEEQEEYGVDPDTGYGESLRGGGAICFGHKAVTDFLRNEGLSYIMRAHEAHADGVAVSKGARVFTVFSTSKDHNQGTQAMAGCILVDFEKMHVINRSPAYKNQYIHRRDSVSLDKLSEREIRQRMKLGLVDDVDDDDDGVDDDDEEDEWEDFDESMDGQFTDLLEEVDVGEYVLDSSRRSFVDPTNTTTRGLFETSNTWAFESNSSIGSMDSSSISGGNRRAGLTRFPSISEVVNEDDDDDEKQLKVADVSMDMAE
eukprot:CAMPEP_0118707456 /NCGR_PEP_ID=MMETSP0800-20121206/21229_1 /TAXON_ID=210618 ORGANISM="Striatella unipunctata, Strain CCMP2910" /NCGR_SAMPLE_ID=MMETSP0800 /ASSEMBLY_ACC=CAM_ASM_000638 /LENGTH=512 /DNA_ID=CAMNT_0006610315 /DNA_START=360 /DNA_END=1898 /DNA_ORIENTATION=-